VKLLGPSKAWREIMSTPAAPSIRWQYETIRTDGGWQIHRQINPAGAYATFDDVTEAAQDAIARAKARGFHVQLMPPGPRNTAAPA
jgi:hypothetical protein